MGRRRNAPIRGDLDRELERIGFGTDGAITPLDALPHRTPHDGRAHRMAEAQLARLPKEERPAVRAEIVERTAYTWINRLLALRTMEARGLIEETLRTNPAYEGVSEALYMLRYEEPQQHNRTGRRLVGRDRKRLRGAGTGAARLFDLDDPNVALRRRRRRCCAVSRPWASRNWTTSLPTPTPSPGPTSSIRKRPRHASTPSWAAAARWRRAARSRPPRSSSPNRTWSSGCCRTAWAAPMPKPTRTRPARNLGILHRPREDPG